MYGRHRLGNSFALLAFASALALPQVAEACSGCPAQNLWPAPASEVPVNVLGFASQYDFEGRPKLFEVDSMTEIPIEIFDTKHDAIVYPGEPLEVGQSYRLEFSEHWCNGPTSWTLVAGEPIDIPNAGLGTLSAGDLGFGTVPIPDDASCSEDTEAAYVDIELELDPALADIEPYLMYETEIDGQRWVHQTSIAPNTGIAASWRGRKRDRIVWLCEFENKPSSGRRNVRMLARLPGRPDIVFTSNAIEIEVDCEPDEDGTEDTGGETGNPGAAESGSSGCAVERDRPPLAGLVLLMFALPGIRRKLR